MTETSGRNRVLRYTFALLTVGVALATSIEINLLAYRASFAFFFAAVIVSTWYGGRYPGLVAIVASALVAEYFLVPPIYSLRLDPAGAFELGVFLGVALLINWLTAGFQQREKAVRANEEKIRENEARLLEIFGNCPVAVLINRWRDRTFVDVNKEFTRLTGWTRDEVFGRTTVELNLIDEEDAVGLRLRLEEQHVLADKEVKIRTKDGEIRYVIMGTVLIEMTGERHAVTTFVDISARRKAEEARKLSDDRLRIVTENARVGLVMVDNSRRYTFANSAYADILGLPSDDIVGKRVADLLSPVYEDQIRPRLDRAFAGERVAYQLHQALEDGDRYYAVRYEPLQGEGPVSQVIVVITDITGQNLAELARIASEGRYRTLFEYAPDGILIADKQSYYLDANETMCRMLGYTREEFIGMHASDIVILDEMQHIEPALDVIKSGSGYNREWQFRRKDGTRFAGEVIATQMPDGNLLGVVRDITARRESENALLRSEEQLAGIIGSAMDGIITINGMQRIVLFNAAAERMFLRPAENAIGEPIDIFIPERFRFAHKAHIEDFGLTMVTRRTMASLGGIFGIRSNGEEFPIEASISQIESGGEKFYTVILRDITERKQEEAARDSLAAIVESSDDAIISKDLDGRIISWNSAAEKMFGYTRQEMFGKSILKLIPPDRLGEEPEIIARIMRGEITDHFETVRVGKDDVPIDVSVTISPIRGSDGKICGASKIVRNITEKKRLEEQLLQSQKMEAVGLLAGGIAHDFNNLLTVINGYSDLTLKKLLPDDPLSGNIREIRDAGNRAAALTSQLLAFSRKQILKPKVHNINSVISEMEKMLRRIITENIEFQIALDPDLGNIKADPGQMEQVIMNLAVNARDAMSNGGRLMIETENIYLDEDYVSQHIEIVPGPFVKLSITDTGEGMGEKTRKQIFDPFFTTKEIGKGTGLGLSTVYGIVKQTGGDIMVYSEIGHGTTFKIYIPRVDENISAPKRAVGPESYAGTETILLVEDEDIVRNLTHKILKNFGYTVLEATGGNAALLTCETYPDTIHLLLTDMVMPGMSGIELKEQVTESRPQIKFLFMSGYTDDSLTSIGMLDLETAFIEKPFTPDSLAQKIREVLKA